MREFTMPSPAPIHRVVAGHTLSLGKFRDEIAEQTAWGWSDPIWRGPEDEGKRAFLALCSAVEKGMDPQNVRVYLDGVTHKVVPLDEWFDMIDSGLIDPDA